MALQPKLLEAGIPSCLFGFSAIDSYLGRKNSSAAHIHCEADLSDLARLFEGLRYPGAVFADAAVDSDGKTWYFSCEETRSRCASFGFLDFFQNCKNKRFYDPGGLYTQLRSLRDGTEFSNAAAPWYETAKAHAHSRRILCDGAMILAKYFPDTGSRELNVIKEELRCTHVEAPGIEEQRQLLNGLLETENPSAGFELLFRSGYISAYWPELAMMNEVDHSKEFHPEGNVWKHTMEALRHRKATSCGFDLRLSLGLLLHDTGKPLSKSAGSRRFDGHAELGTKQARRFLERLGFDSSLTDDACYLVRNHMLPAALPRLPLIRTGEIMESPLFPLLLELYRCDEASSFKGLDGYYQSSAAYRSWLKHRRNPYRSLTAAY